MNPLATSALCFSFASSIPVGLDEGHITVGGAVHAETGERLTSIRMFADDPPELIGEYWLTERETLELVQRLLGMESWFCPVETESPVDRGGEVD